MNEPSQSALDMPLLSYADKRRIERVGVVDVGSNSVRMVVFDGAARSPAYFYNEKIMCALGDGLAQTGRLNPLGWDRAMKALKRFVLLAKGMEIGPLHGVATAAVRDASDGAAFCAQVLQETGLNLRVASGEDEARLSAQGVLLGWPDANGLMCDIGGASMELARISNGGVGDCISTGLGPLKLSALNPDDGSVTRTIDAALKNLPGGFAQETRTLYLVGGSWRAIATLDMARRDYPLKVLHEYKMAPADLMATLDWIDEHDVASLRAVTGSSKARMRLIPIAAQVLRALLVTFRPGVIAASSYGIREGLLYEQMPAALRARDPLIEACLHMESASARAPGFGKVLHAFLSPLFEDADPPRARLIKAACLLHDVTWRAHPDYRAEVCFDNATRANLGGLDHRGRVFLGLALLHRYKNTGGGTVFESVVGLLDPEQRRHAKILGKAMRFGAMLSGPSKKMMGQLVLNTAENVLELRLSPDAGDLYGEVVLARFDSLARALECTGRVTIH